jgi:hypothetical protein
VNGGAGTSNQSMVRLGEPVTKLAGGVTMVQRSLTSLAGSKVKYCIDMSSLEKNLYPLRLVRISWIQGTG